MAKYLASVRYGMMANVENFQSDVDGLTRDAIVILKTDRGLEWGEITSEVQEIDREVKGLGEIMRIATEGDLGIIRHIRETKEPEQLEYCRKKIRERNLPMKLVGVENLFSSDKIVFYFLADGRVDFRELVKDLARYYRARIEMRQIGVRDEAKLLSDHEHCGQELCCRTFIKHLEPVTMRMAKMQKTTLDPNKISGHCGRLMCCLRFEDEVYNELRKELPKKGKFVATNEFQGEVVSLNIIKQMITLRLSDGSREMIHVSEVQEVLNRDEGRKRMGRERDERDSRGGRGGRSGSSQSGRYQRREERKPPPPPSSPMDDADDRARSS